MYLPAIFVCSASCVALFIAWVKWREPLFSMELSKSHVRYNHKFGSWQLTWQNIQRIDIPRVTSGLTAHNLDMVGFRIKDYQALLDTISPRLSSALLMEQRPLLLHDSAAQCAKGNCHQLDEILHDHYVTPNGVRYTGLQASLGHRMTTLRRTLGYDLFIAAAELDRPADEFVGLLRRCHQFVLSEREPD